MCVKVTRSEADELGTHESQGVGGGVVDAEVLRAVAAEVVNELAYVSIRRHTSAYSGGSTCSRSSLVYPSSLMPHTLVA